MKYLLATAILLTLVVISGCDVTCDIVSETPDPDSNSIPSESIAINFTFDKKEVTSMEVVHLLRDGQEIVRSSQYSMKLTTEENENSMVIRWTGKHKKNPSLTMTGTLQSETSEKAGLIGWYYTEALYDLGKLDHVLVARCKEKKVPLPQPRPSDADQWQ